MSQFESNPTTLVGKTARLKIMTAQTIFWNWYWRERSGVLLFRRVHGAGRLTFELPVLLLGGYAWYLYLFSLPAIGLNWVLSMFSNPFGLVGILCIGAYEIGISYLRDQIPIEGGFLARLNLCLPGRVLELYRKQRGSDLAVKVIRWLQFAAFGSFAIAMFVSNWRRISH